MSTTKTLFRIQDEYNQGVYRSDNAIDIYSIMNWQKDGVDRHPLPDEDSLFVKNAALKGFEGYNFSMKMKSYNYAFDSIKSLRSWFYNDSVLDKLDDNGFMIFVYEVDEADIIEGNSQVAFIHERAKEIRTQSLTSLI